MSEHTKGPWFYELHDLPLGKGRVISIQSRETFDPDDEDDDPTLAGIYSLDPVDFANAKLIAAAPELLKALIECEGYIGSLAGVTGESLDIFNNAGRAIAKAIK